jgi:hypothetical protein
MPHDVENHEPINRFIEDRFRCEINEIAFKLGVALWIQHDARLDTGCGTVQGVHAPEVSCWEDRQPRWSNPRCSLHVLDAP